MPRASRAACVFPPCPDALPVVDPRSLVESCTANATHHPLGVATAGPTQLSIADLTADGVDDLIVASPGADAFALFAGTGTGSLVAPIFVPTGGNEPRNVVVLDVEEDGLGDVVTANYLSGDLSVVLRSGPSSFAPATNVAVGRSPSGIAVDDLAGVPSPGQPLTFEIENALGPSSGSLFFGVTQSSLPLPAGCTFLVSPILPVILALPLLGAGPGNGSIQWTSAIPFGTPHSSFTMQTFVIDAGASAGYCATNGIEVQIL